MKKTVLLFVLLLMVTSSTAYAVDSTLPWPEQGEDVDLDQLQGEIVAAVLNLDGVITGLSQSSKRLVLHTTRKLTSDERQAVNVVARTHVPIPRPSVIPLKDRVTFLEDLLFQIDMEKLLRIIEIYGD